ncbi:MAG: hypothetical protein G3M70_08460 [Candidatus Nitronauta litoralis]|uniref:Uncharacterized protein n=1 Tax=Candidatus Nitronauta litoralis TaxID=2705533 RepID=A0A7T0BVW7_9BACT|nr:MAG: hypothetical protein G3M70_08460 [Candidatus Nitronauta litoralis]
MQKHQGNEAGFKEQPSTRTFPEKFKEVFNLIIVGYAMQKKASKNRTRLSVQWDGDQLKELKVV